MRPAWRHYVWVAPAAALILLTGVFPLVSTAWLSLHRRYPIFGVNEFIGLANYIHLAGNPRFLRSVVVTLAFTVASVALEFVLGLLCALALRRDFRGHRWVLAALLVPWIVPTSVSARMWEWIYNAKFGVLNHLLLSFGLLRDPVVWVGTPTYAMAAAVGAEVWKTTPFMTLLLLAGLKGIPESLYRAAAIDGATPWQAFRHVTWPMLKPIALVALLFRSLDAVRVFDVIYVLTGGGPAGTTETLSIYAYRQLFQNLDLGYGSAVGLTLFALAGAVSLFFMTVLRVRAAEAK